MPQVCIENLIRNSTGSLDDSVIERARERRERARIDAALFFLVSRAVAAPIFGVFGGKEIYEAVESFSKGGNVISPAVTGGLMIAGAILYGAELCLALYDEYRLHRDRN